jgi:DNA-binding MarR family transcriptional regulator
MTTRWLTPLELKAWRYYVETQANLFAALEHDLAEHDIPLGGYEVLVFLSEADDRTMRMCDLADDLQLSPSGLTRRLDGLVRAGFVGREGSVKDRRVMMAVLTKEGLAALDSIFTSISEGLDQ